MWTHIKFWLFSYVMDQFIYILDKEGNWVRPGNPWRAYALTHQPLWSVPKPPMEVEVRPIFPNHIQTPKHVPVRRITPERVVDIPVRRVVDVPVVRFVDVPVVRFVDVPVNYASHEPSVATLEPMYTDWIPEEEILEASSSLAPRRCNTRSGYHHPPKVSAALVKQLGGGKRESLLKQLGGRSKKSLMKQLGGGY